MLYRPAVIQPRFVVSIRDTTQYHDNVTTELIKIKGLKCQLKQPFLESLIRILSKLAWADIFLSPDRHWTGTSRPLTVTGPLSNPKTEAHWEKSHKLSYFREALMTKVCFLRVATLVLQKKTYRLFLFLRAIPILNSKQNCKELKPKRRKIAQSNYRQINVSIYRLSTVFIKTVGYPQSLIYSICFS